MKLKRLPMPGVLWTWISPPSKCASSREIDKPCVIGTKFATQIIKDGDLVEVELVDPAIPEPHLVGPGDLTELRIDHPGAVPQQPRDGVGVRGGPVVGHLVGQPVDEVVDVFGDSVPTFGDAATGLPYAQIVASGDARDGDVVAFPSTLPAVREASTVLRGMGKAFAELSPETKAMVGDVFKVSAAVAAAALGAAINRKHSDVAETILETAATMLGGPLAGKALHAGQADIAVLGLHQVGAM